MLKKSCFIFAGISLLVLVLVGCNKTAVTQAEVISNSYSTTMREEDIPTAESIQQLSEDVIYDRYTDAENIRFEDYECIDDISYLAFSYMNNQITYFGFVVAEQDGNQLKLAWFEDFPVFQEKPISVVKWGGSYPGTEDRVIHITAGYVNDEAIEEIVLYYPGSITKEIKLDEAQKVFFDINLDPDAYLLKFEGKSGKGKIIYQEDYNRS